MPGQTRRLRPLEPVLTSAWHRVEVLPQRELLTEEERAEWESEDEVEYVTLEFGSHLTDEVLNLYGELQLLGAEAPNPVARVGHKHFQGVHETLIGNDILFKHQPEATPSYVPFATSSHRITFQPVHIVHDPNKASSMATDDAVAFDVGAGAPGTSGRGRGKKVVAAATSQIGPDGEPVRRKPGRPRGSKNKNPLRRRAERTDQDLRHEQENDLLDRDAEGVAVAGQRLSSALDVAMLDAQVEEKRPNGRGNPPAEHDEEDDLYE